MGFPKRNSQLTNNTTMKEGGTGLGLGREDQPSLGIGGWGGYDRIVPTEEEGVTTTGFRVGGMGMRRGTLSPSTNVTTNLVNRDNRRLEMGGTSGEPQSNTRQRRYQHEATIDRTKSDKPRLNYLNLPDTNQEIPIQPRMGFTTTTGTSFQKKPGFIGHNRETPFQHKTGFNTNKETTFTPGMGFTTNKKTPLNSGTGFTTNKETPFIPGTGFTASKGAPFNSGAGFSTNKETPFTPGTGFNTNKETPFTQNPGYKFPPDPAPRTPWDLNKFTVNQEFLKSTHNQPSQQNKEFHTEFSFGGPSGSTSNTLFQDNFRKNRMNPNPNQPNPILNQNRIFTNPTDQPNFQFNSNKPSETRETHRSSFPTTPPRTYQDNPKYLETSNQSKIPIHFLSRTIDKRRPSTNYRARLKHRQHQGHQNKGTSFVLPANQQHWISSLKTTTPTTSTVKPKSFSEKKGEEQFNDVWLDDFGDGMIPRKKLDSVLQELRRAKLTIRRHQDYITSLEDVLETSSKEINLPQLQRKVLEVKTQFDHLNATKTSDELLFRRRKDLLASSITKLDEFLSDNHQTQLNSSLKYSSQIPTTDLTIAHQRIKELEKKYLEVCQLSKTKDKYIATLEGHDLKVQLELARLSQETTCLKVTDTHLNKLCEKLDGFIAEYQIAPPVIAVDDSFITGPNSWPRQSKATTSSDPTPPLASASILSDKITQIIRHPFSRHPHPPSPRLPGTFPLSDPDPVPLPPSRPGSRRATTTPSHSELDEIIRKIQATRMGIASSYSSSRRSHQPPATTSTSSSSHSNPKNKPPSLE